MKRGCIIAIDGPSGAGKSSVSREVARRLNYLYLDTGAMYRATALQAQRQGVSWDDAEALKRMCEGLEIELVWKDGKLHTLLGGEDVSEAIRTPEMSRGASRVSAHPPVREKLWELQRRVGREGGVVAEGRDIGTVVFPEAECKFYLDASPEVRARRRFEELRRKGLEVDFETTLNEVRQRDQDDQARALAPLKPAPDAVIIDSTSLTEAEVVEVLLRLVAEAQSRRR